MLVALIVYLSLNRRLPEPMMFNNFDKLEHAFAYASLSLWFCQIYCRLRARVITMTALVGLGVGLEYVQGWAGYRAFEVMDMLADSFGVLLGWALVITPLGCLFVRLESLAKKI